MTSSQRSGVGDRGAVLESLYEAALDPELLPQALHVFARAFNATTGNIIGMADHQGRLIISPDGKDAADAYAAGWWTHDFVTERAVAWRARGIVTDLDLATEVEIAKSPFYQEFARQYDMHWLCANVVVLPDGTPFSVTIRRSERFGPFLGHEIEDLAPLARHAARAFDLAVKLSAARSQANGLCETLTALGYGVIGLGDTGGVMFTNKVADSIGSDGITVSSGAVLAATPGGQRALSLLISETLALADGRAVEPARPVALHRPSGRLPAVVYGVPVPPQHGDVMALLGGRPRALLVIIEPDTKRRLDEHLLQELFGLSPGEARLAAAIVTGATPREAAARFGTRESTVRVVLKRVFHKTGVSRQAELALLLAPLLLDGKAFAGSE
jgi:DNA-binding CsgD family transcriptional regulator